MQPDEIDDNEKIMLIDDLEACVERVFASVRGLREDKCALVLAIAQYGLLWFAADAHIIEAKNAKARKKARGKLIHAVLTHSTDVGRQYAEIMIAEGHLRARVRESQEPHGSWPAR